MNSPVISQINRTIDCMEDLPHNDTQSLIKQLSSSDGFTRKQAREALTCIGKSAILELLNTLTTANLQLRWEIIKVLEGISDPTTIPILVEQLKYEHAGVRWAASNALIGMGRDAIPELLEALICDLDSLWLRQSAPHPSRFEGRWHNIRCRRKSVRGVGRCRAVVCSSLGCRAGT